MSLPGAWWDGQSVIINKWTNELKPLFDWFIFNAKCYNKKSSFNGAFPIRHLFVILQSRRLVEIIYGTSLGISAISDDTGSIIEVQQPKFNDLFLLLLFCLFLSSGIGNNLLLLPLSLLLLMTTVTASSSQSNTVTHVDISLCKFMLVPSIFSWKRAKGFWCITDLQLL